MAEIPIEYFNSFILKKTVNSDSGQFDANSKSYYSAVFPGIPNNPTNYPLFRTTTTGAEVQAIGRMNTSSSIIGTDGRNWIIEEARIRGGYNNAYVGQGPRAFLVERSNEQVVRNNALIYSGVFNSKTELNETNVFSVGEQITRAVDPNYGSIQKIHALDSNLAILQENKVSNALIDKDAIYTAEGSASAITAAKVVIGQITPYVGEYGISRNPESFAYHGYRRYFTDKYRNSVMRLSRDGLTEISGYGMSDFFRDEFAKINDNFKSKSFSLPLSSTSTNPFKIILNSVVGNVETIEKGMTVSIPQLNGGIVSALVVGIVSKNIVYLNINPGTTPTTLEITTNQNNFTNGTYTGTVGSTSGYTTSGSGSGMVLTIIVQNNTVVSVTAGPQLGVNFSIGDTITVAGTALGVGEQNLVLTIRGVDVTFTKFVKDRIVGGWDSYNKNYVLSAQDKSEDPNVEDEFKTLSFEDDINGWTSFYSYQPDFMGSSKNKYYSFFNSEIYEHYDQDPSHKRTTFYGTRFGSSIDFIFNANPSIVKNFKTVNYEGSNGWQIDTFLSDFEGFDAQDNNQFQYQDSAKQVLSYDGGLYTQDGIPYRAGFNRKENKYFANLINNSTARPGEIFFGDSTTGIKGFLATVKVSTDTTTDVGGSKELFAVSTEFVVSSR